MLNSILGTEITLPVFFLCTGVSLVLGIAMALISMFKSKCTQSFAVTLAILPAVVQIVIMLVNGSVGAGVAVAGAFSLVRFRSAAGTAREIAMIFISMAIGLACGMGYVVIAAIFFGIMAGMVLLLTGIQFGAKKTTERTLKITIPETLDYDGLFDDLFETYTQSHSLERVRTSNMGTLYELQYHIRLKGEQAPKEFLDALRCRNGNLDIVCSKEVIQETL